MRMKPDYCRILDDFKAQLIEEIDDKIRSIILFGSVARREANWDSDIDVLIIADSDFATKQRVHDISYDVDLANEVFTQIIFFTPEGLELEMSSMSFFIQDVLEQGIVLYDDGTYGRIREKESQSLSRIPR